jgi:hypothetical protein
MNNIGGKIIIINIRTGTPWEIKTKSLKDISTTTVKPMVTSIARIVKSFPFVTDVR